MDAPYRPRPLGVLGEQAEYYRAAAGEYEDHALPFSGHDELVRVLDAFRPQGQVLELACGPGTWTPHLLRHAQEVTAVDASEEMLAIAASRAGEERVRYVRGDLFDWEPDERYDVVFFGFWLSHVPSEHFASFWSMVDRCLTPDGRVLFVDDHHRGEDELIEGADSVVVQRRLNDGSAHRIIKVPHRPDDLKRRLADLGWSIDVHAVPDGPFYWGAGRRAAA
jgi:SAM-dependent methyltransferase